MKFIKRTEIIKKETQLLIIKISKDIMSLMFNILNCNLFHTVWFKYTLSSSRLPEIKVSLNSIFLI